MEKWVHSLCIFIYLKFCFQANEFNICLSPGLEAHKAEGMSFLHNEIEVSQSGAYMLW